MMLVYSTPPESICILGSSVSCSANTACFVLKLLEIQKQVTKNKLHVCKNNE